MLMKILGSVLRRFHDGKLNADALRALLDLARRTDHGKKLNAKKWPTPHIVVTTLRVGAFALIVQLYKLAGVRVPPMNAVRLFRVHGLVQVTDDNDTLTQKCLGEVVNDPEIVSALSADCMCSCNEIAHRCQALCFVKRGGKTTLEQVHHAACRLNALLNDYVSQGSTGKKFAVADCGTRDGHGAIETMTVFKNPSPCNDALGGTLSVFGIDDTGPSVDFNNNAKTNDGILKDFEMRIREFAKGGFNIGQLSSAFHPDALSRSLYDALFDRFGDDEKPEFALVRSNRSTTALF